MKQHNETWLGQQWVNTGGRKPRGHSFCVKDVFGNLLVLANIFKNRDTGEIRAEFVREIPMVTLDGEIESTLGLIDRI